MLECFFDVGTQQKNYKPKNYIKNIKLSMAKNSEQA